MWSAVVLMQIGQTKVIEILFYVRVKGTFELGYMDSPSRIARVWRARSIGCFDERTCIQLKYVSFESRMKVWASHTISFGPGDALVGACQMSISQGH